MAEQQQQARGFHDQQRMEIQRLHTQMAEAQTSSQTSDLLQAAQTMNVLQTLAADNASLRKAFEESQMQMKALFDQFANMSALLCQVHGYKCSPARTMWHAATNM